MFDISWVRKYELLFSFVSFAFQIESFECNSTLVIGSIHSGERCWRFYCDARARQHTDAIYCHRIELCTFQFSVKHLFVFYSLLSPIPFFFFNPLTHLFFFSAKWRNKKNRPQSEIKYLSSFWSSLIGFRVKSSSIGQ